MTHEEIKNLLKDGFNVAMLAEAFNCSIGRINELKSEPVEGKIYHKADINCDALLNFAIKHEVDLNSIDFKKICDAKKVTKNEKINYEVGTVTSFGTITMIEKIGQAFCFLITTPENKLIMKSLKELQASEK